jgi:hypothetical protein
MEAQFWSFDKLCERSWVTHALELRSTTESVQGKSVLRKAITDIRKVIGTLRSQERPKLKSSLFSLSIQKSWIDEQKLDNQVQLQVGIGDVKGPDLESSGQTQARDQVYPLRSVTG